MSIYINGCQITKMGDLTKRRLLFSDVRPGEDIEISKCQAAIIIDVKGNAVSWLGWPSDPNELDARQCRNKPKSGNIFCGSHGQKIRPFKCQICGRGATRRTDVCGRCLHWVYKNTKESWIDLCANHRRMNDWITINRKLTGTKC